MLKFIILFIAAYLAGSVNFAILLFKLLGKDDPREKFSRNAGTTNVLRQAGKFWAIVVLLLDMGRAMAVAAVSLYLLERSYCPAIGFALIAGNRFPCFHSFRGGKGVANYFGFTAYLAPLTAGIGAAVWVIAYGISRLPFIASIFMVLSLAAGTVIVSEFNAAASLGAAATALFIIANHKNNFVSLRKKDRL